MFAASGPFANIVELLLNEGAEVNLRTLWKAGALTFAAAEGNLNVVEILLRYEADISFVDDDENTALNVAKNNNLQEVVKLLQEQI